MRREVMAALLRGGRHDLANVLAKTPTGPKKPRAKKPKPKDDDPVQSTTGRKIRDSIGHLPQFKDFEPDNWNHLGNHVKKYANTTVVFTGAISALLLWAFQKGKLLPMTRHYGIDAGALGVQAGFLKPNYQDRYLDFLEDGGVLEKTTMTTKQALSANHTKQDAKNAKERPTSTTAVYTAGEALPGIVKLLAKYGARLGTVIANTKAETVQAGRKQVVYLGHTGPNGANEWVVVQYRNLPNGSGEKVVKVSTRQGVEPGVGSNVQWTDIPYIRQYMRNMRHKLSRPGVMLLNKLAHASVSAGASVPFESLKKGTKLQLTVRYEDTDRDFVMNVRVMEDVYDYGGGWLDTTVKVPKDQEPRSLSKKHGKVTLTGMRSGVGHVVDGVK